jgi:hypothetical protein
MNPSHRDHSMAAPSADDRGFEAALEAISSLITRRKRADGANWGDAFALMDTYLKVCASRCIWRFTRLVLLPVIE